MEMQHLLSNDLVDIDNDASNYWIPRFILEVRLNEMALSTFQLNYQMICRLQCHLQRSRPSISFFSIVYFSSIVFMFYNYYIFLFNFNLSNYGYYKALQVFNRYENLWLTNQIAVFFSLIT